MRRLPVSTGDVFLGFAVALPLVAVVAAKGVVVVLLITALLTGSLHWRRSGSLPRVDRTVFLLLTGLLTWAAVISIWAPAPLSAVILVVRLSLLFGAGLLLLAAARDLEQAARERVGRGFVLGVVLAFAYLAVEILLDFPLTRALEGPIPAHADPGHWTNRGVAILAMLVWPAAAFLWRRFSGFALVIPGGLALLLPFLESGAAFLGLIAGLVLAGIGLVHRRAGRVVVALVVVLALAGAPLIAKQFAALDWDKADWLSRSTQQRVVIWNFAADRILEKPLFGWGFDAFRHVPNLEAEPPDFTDQAIPLHPHNAGLQIYFELGLVGIVFTIALLFTVLRRMRRLRGPAYALAQGQLLAMLAMTSTTFSIWQNYWLSAMLAAAVMTVLCRDADGTEVSSAEAPSG